MDLLCIPKLHLEWKTPMEEPPKTGWQLLPCKKNAGKVKLGKFRWFKMVRHSLSVGHGLSSVPASNGAYVHSNQNNESRCKLYFSEGVRDRETDGRNCLYDGHRSHFSVLETSCIFYMCSVHTALKHTLKDSISSSPTLCVFELIERKSHKQLIHEIVSLPLLFSSRNILFVHVHNELPHLHLHINVFRVQFVVSRL